MKTTHLEGRPSTARIQRCVFCGKSVRPGVVHVLNHCENFAGQRGLLQLRAHTNTPELDADVARTYLQCPARSPHFALHSFEHGGGDRHRSHSFLGRSLLK